MAVGLSPGTGTRCTCIPSIVWRRGSWRDESEGPGKEPQLLLSGFSPGVVVLVLNCLLTVAANRLRRIGTVTKRQNLKLRGGRQSSQRKPVPTFRCLKFGQVQGLLPVRVCLLGPASGFSISHERSAGCQLGTVGSRSHGFVVTAGN